MSATTTRPSASSTPNRERKKSKLPSTASVAEVSNAEGDQGQPFATADFAQRFMAAGKDVKWEQDEKGQEIAHAGKGEGGDVL